MAHYMELGNETDLKWVFNVSFPVGPGASNRWDDVMLVQHALNAILPHYEIRDAKGRIISSYLKRDGLFGSRTAAAIVGYQNYVRSVRRKLISNDGRVDPAVPTGWTLHGENQFTIVHLNRDHRNLHGRMMEEKDFPEKLRDVLTQQRGRRGQLYQRS